MISRVTWNPVAGLSLPTPVLEICGTCLQEKNNEMDRDCILRMDGNRSHKRITKQTRREKREDQRKMEQLANSWWRPQSHLNIYLLEYWLLNTLARKQEQLRDGRKKWQETADRLQHNSTCGSVWWLIILNLASFLFFLFWGCDRIFFPFQYVGHLEEILQIHRHCCRCTRLRKISTEITPKRLACTYDDTLTDIMSYFDF